MAPACMTDTRLAERLDCAIFDLFVMPNSLTTGSDHLHPHRSGRANLSLFEVRQRQHSANDTDIHPKQGSSEASLEQVSIPSRFAVQAGCQLTAAAKANTLQL
jgi:hypothetical protein